MLSYRTIKMTDTFDFKNISELVRNELRQSYLHLCVRVEENKIIDISTLKMYNNIKETDL